MKLQDKLKILKKGEIGVCVGLDPVLEKLPEHLHSHPEPFFEFNRQLIDETAEFAAAYKPNLAFYEVLGASGWTQLKKTIDHIPEDKLIIADAKRGDIGNTARAYAKAVFETLGADMVTVNPYLGGDSIQPFLENPDKGCFILSLTTNPGGADIQELICDSKPVFMHIVDLANRLNVNSNTGLVIGATKVSLWGEITSSADNLPLLIPGIGAQGGSIEALRKAVSDYDALAYVNASRSIIYASNSRDFHIRAGNACLKLKQSLN